MDDESCIKAVKHYQSCLDKYTEGRNESKLLHCLEKLYKLPVKVAHLEATGVGRTVNNLRKLGGEVGDSAKRVVAKWKEMVVIAHEAEEGEYDNDEDDDDEDEDDDDEDAKELKRQVCDTKEANGHRSDSSEVSSPSYKRGRVEEDSHQAVNSPRNTTSSKHSSRGHDVKKGHSSNHGSTKRKIESDDETDEEGGGGSRGDDNNKRHHTPNKTARADHDEVANRAPRSSQHHHGNSNNNNKRRIDSDSDCDRSTNRESGKGGRKQQQHGTEKKHKSSTSSSTTSSSNNKDKDKSDGKSTNSDRHHHKSNKDKAKSKSDDKKSSEKKHRSSHHDQDSSKSRDKSSSKKVAATSSRHGNSGKSATPRKDLGMESGGSFAEALGMLEASSSKTGGGSKKKASGEKEKVKEREKEKEKVAVRSSDDALVPKLLKEPVGLDPIDINISSLLPSITPNYRPLGFNTDAQPKRILTDYEALSNIISSKKERTKVYSGNKMAWGKVPTLFEMCIRILQDNIEALEYTGGVPYHILKPILEKANPDQLFTLENHNPYLIEDTDELWQLLCQKDFRNKKREELESWREMYMRCLDEREAKLKALTANIKQSQDKSVPVRTTKLAYVDAVAKPPRNIARKQAKNGTAFDLHKKPAVTPSSRLSTIATSGEAGKISVPNPGARAMERSSHSQQVVKPKKAPLMAKSLSLLKNRFRR